MELRQLQYLLAVVEEQSFTKAAARLHVAQPWVSAQVRQLETELGQTLVDRSPNGVRPTTVGAAVLPHARGALAAVTAVSDTVDQLAGLLRGHVTVATVPSVASRAVNLPRVLADFHHQHPDVEIALLEDNSDQIITALQDSLIDLGLVGDTGPQPAGIETQIVADEPLVAAVSPDHPLATQTTIALGKLKDQPLISLPRGTGLRLRLEQACATAGFTPRIAFEASDPRTLVALAAQRLGIAIITHAAADTYAPEVQAVKITRPELRARLKLAWRSQQRPISPAAHALTDHARRQLSSQVGEPGVGVPQAAASRLQATFTGGFRSEASGLPKR